MVNEYFNNEILNKLKFLKIENTKYFFVFSISNEILNNLKKLKVEKKTCVSELLIMF
jgi:hypothetical protein